MMKAGKKSKTRTLAANMAANGKLVQAGIPSAHNEVPRAGWKEQIRKTLAEHAEGLDVEWLNAPPTSEFDEKDWTW